MRSIIHASDLESIMNTLKRSAIVPYSARQMYELVNSIEDYPRFLPWCSKSTVISRDDKEVVASLEIAWKGMHKSFTTRNHLHPHHAMEIELVDGPMQHLEGKWEFLALNDQACKVMLDMDFAFSGNLLDKLFQPIFQHIANTLVDAFCKQAVERYGNE
jgi:ribosome-associated toxin RatA of RatAB toxin-antitoxin module